MKLPALLDIALRVAVVCAVWLVLWRDWSVLPGDIAGVRLALEVAGRLALAIIVASWAIRAYRFRGRTDA